MPLYEYQCDDCGGRFERIRKFSDPPLDEPCPICGGPIRKLLSSPAIQFKGSGWYVNDYAKSGAKDEPKADAAPDAKTDAKKGDTTDTKTEPKTGKTDSKTDTASKPAAPSATAAGSPKNS